MTAEADRTTLPDLSVEVVAGNRHTRIAARNNAINLDLSGASGPIAAAIPSSSVASAAAASTSVTNTAERVRSPSR